MEFKKFIIDVDENTRENAVFYGDDFVCFEDDIDSLLEKLNELNSEVVTLRVKNVGLETDIRRLKDIRQLYYINLDDLERIIIKSITMCMTDVNAVALAEKATYLKVNEELKKLNHTIKNAFRNFRELGEL